MGSTPLVRVNSPLSSDLITDIGVFPSLSGKRMTRDVVVRLDRLILGRVGVELSSGDLWMEVLVVYGCDSGCVRCGKSLEFSLDEWDMGLNEFEICSLDFPLDSSDDRSYRSVPDFGRCIPDSRIARLYPIDVYWVINDPTLCLVDQWVEVWLEYSIVIGVGGVT